MNRLMNVMEVLKAIEDKKLIVKAAMILHYNGIRYLTEAEKLEMLKELENLYHCLDTTTLMELLQKAA